MVEPQPGKSGAVDNTWTHVHHMMWSKAKIIYKE